MKKSLYSIMVLGCIMLVLFVGLTSCDSFSLPINPQDIETAKIPNFTEKTEDVESVETTKKPTVTEEGEDLETVETTKKPALTEETEESESVETTKSPDSTNETEGSESTEAIEAEVVVFEDMLRGELAAEDGKNGAKITVCAYIENDMSAYFERLEVYDGEKLVLTDIEYSGFAEYYGEISFQQY